MMFPLVVGGPRFTRGHRPTPSTKKPLQQPLQQSTYCWTPPLRQKPFLYALDPVAHVIRPIVNWFFVVASPVNPKNSPRWLTSKSQTELSKTVYTEKFVAFRHWQVWQAAIPLPMLSAFGSISNALTLPLMIRLLRKNM